MPGQVAELVFLLVPIAVQSRTEIIAGPAPGECTARQMRPLTAQIRTGQALWLVRGTLGRALLS